MSKKETKKLKLEKITQDLFVQKLSSPDDLMLFKCTCGSPHFRHAGYVEQITPYSALKLSEGPVLKASISSIPVKICVACWKSYIEMDGKVYDITSHINIHAWKESEIKLQELTGPGGEC